MKTRTGDLTENQVAWVHKLMSDIERLESARDSDEARVMFRGQPLPVTDELLTNAIKAEIRLLKSALKELGVTHKRDARGCYARDSYGRRIWSVPGKRNAVGQMSPRAQRASDHNGSLYED